jgi:hypothetical protein
VLQQQAHTHTHTYRETDCDNDTNGFQKTHSSYMPPPLPPLFSYTESDLLYHSIPHATSTSTALLQVSVDSKRVHLLLWVGRRGEVTRLTRERERERERDERNDATSHGSSGSHQGALTVLLRVVLGTWDRGRAGGLMTGSSRVCKTS